MDIHYICKKYKITNYTVNDDGSIDVDGSVKLSEYKLTELPLTFNKVTGYFYCDYSNLTSLKGCPRWVGSTFSCENNDLTSLEFSPDYVGSNFWCRFNKLTDNYCDTEIVGSFYTSLEQDKLTEYNYNEWRKIHKRKLTLNELYTRTM